MDLSAYIDAVSLTTDIRSLKHLLTTTLDRQGVRAVSGYAFPFGGGATTDRDPIISTFPETVSSIYRNALLGKDPIMFAAMTLGMPIHFSKIEHSLHLTNQAQALIQAMRDAGLHDGVATPVFAKPGAYGYFSAAFDRVRSDLSQADLRRFQIIFSEFFFRYRELSVRRSSTLSKREREVLVGIVNDQSNIEIAGLLGVSEHTVETYVRRCFAKLEVDNRTQAALRFLGGAVTQKPAN